MIQRLTRTLDIASAALVVFLYLKKIDSFAHNAKRRTQKTDRVNICRSKNLTKYVVDRNPVMAGNRLQIAVKRLTCCNSLGSGFLFWNKIFIVKFFRIIL